MVRELYPAHDCKHLKVEPQVAIDEFLSSFEKIEGISCDPRQELLMGIAIDICFEMILDDFQANPCHFVTNHLEHCVKPFINR